MKFLNYYLFNFLFNGIIWAQVQSMLLDQSGVKNWQDHVCHILLRSLWNGNNKPLGIVRWGQSCDTWNRWSTPNYLFPFDAHKTPDYRFHSYINSLELKCTLKVQFCVELGWVWCIHMLLVLMRHGRPFTIRLYFKCFLYIYYFSFVHNIMHPCLVGCLVRTNICLLLIY